MNEFQERLQDLMNENNLSRLGLSNKIGIATSAIDDYFNKGYYPSMIIAKKMAEFFDCSLDYLFGRCDEKLNTNKNTKPFFDNLQNLLRENNLSVARAMSEMKLKECSYYKWRKGVFPKTLILLEIVKYFEVSLDYLVGYSNKDE